MNDIDNGRFNSLREFWHKLCSIQLSNGVNLPDRLGAWTKGKEDLLRRAGVCREYEELCSAGCIPISLAIALSTFRISRKTAEIWKSTLGSKRQRTQTIGHLQKAADSLERAHEQLIDAVLAQKNIMLDPDLRRWLSTAPDRPQGRPWSVPWPKDARAQHPMTVVNSLRTYASIVSVFDEISEGQHVHSADSFSRYLLSAYVKRVTNEFHDREVSALISAASGIEGYDETTHRVWRSRNYSKLDQEFSSLAELMCGIGLVIAETA